MFKLRLSAQKMFLRRILSFRWSSLHNFTMYIIAIRKVATKMQIRRIITVLAKAESVECPSLYLVLPLPKGKRQLDKGTKNTRWRGVEKDSME